MRRPDAFLTLESSVEGKGSNRAAKKKSDTIKKGTMMMMSKHGKLYSYGMWLTLFRDSECGSDARSTPYINQDRFPYPLL